jgi:phenylpyruvate tautomerase PptA (4-oxalocrotonate tautomerase family)
MPLYTVTAEDGSISDTTKAKISAEITRIHTEVMKVPKSFVHVVFLSYARGCGFTAGERASAVVVNCIMRAGHSVQEKSNMLKQLWSMFQQLSGVATEQLALSLQESPATNGMEMGQIMPEVVQR